MRIETLGEGRIQVLVSSEDLSQREINIRDLWQYNPNAQKFLSGALREAVDNGVLQMPAGSVSVEAIGLVTEGVAVILTLHKPVIATCPTIEPAPIQREENEGASTKATEVAYVFRSFEDLLSACRRLADNDLGEGNLIHFQGSLYLTIPVGKMQERAVQMLLSEYGERSVYSPLFFTEHGNIIRKGDAPRFIVEKFGQKEGRQKTG
ncbi:hypothetical protein HM1_2352 [Heliomicrobium modesticaldum Ice1]|uniref:Negative regulator of genetic competence n=1 Tax=Heliobacterium modesticaldum (strain ATCC 51547 / Ice1) TaxID=498761 RepID=B0THV0_HELMI|nr:adaptor protein MecA [Heliomicrobium modesticaldum]ABZ84883.1 hypothetical protein HM1_2352 [Heliomicrobium modesticaldum Ice1]